MAWEDAKQAGFALAAILAGDRELVAVSAALVAPAQPGDPGLLPALQARCRGLAGAGSHAGASQATERVRALRELAERVRPALVHAAALPPRGRALVADRVARELGRSYVHAAAPARPGFEPEPQLLSWLTALAARGGGA
jgi:hypothetical protein